MSIWVNIVLFSIAFLQLQILCNYFFENKFYPILLAILVILASEAGRLISGWGIDKFRKLKVLLVITFCFINPYFLISWFPYLNEPIYFFIISSLILGLLVSWPKSLTWSLRNILLTIILSICIALRANANFSKILLPGIPFYQSQQKYKDQVVFEEEKLVVTQARDDYWFYVNDVLNISTFDAFLFYEPFVHPAMSLGKVDSVLVIGNENGYLIRELQKYKVKIFWYPIDRALLASFSRFGLVDDISSQVEMLSGSPKDILSSSEELFDRVFIDAPDPNLTSGKDFYSSSFYMRCLRRLDSEGVIITHTGNPMLDSVSQNSIRIAMKKIGLRVIPMHNQVLTLGEWGWLIATRDSIVFDKRGLSELRFTVDTRWINTEAMGYLLSDPFSNRGDWQ